MAENKLKDKELGDTAMMTWMFGSGSLAKVHKRYVLAANVYSCEKPAYLNASFVQRRAH